ncbi:hypothetical protein INR49_028303, partial [Caranx melampygus]
MLSSSLVIKQTPENHLVNSGQAETHLECYHGDSSYPYVLWYQHKSPAGGQRTMELIGWIQYDKPLFEKSFEGRFNITGHATSKVQLVISNIKPEDSAEYFCAASQHS